MIGAHADEDKARDASRNFSTLDARIGKLLAKLNPRKDPDLLKPVPGANLLTEWERSFGQLGSMILLDEIATAMIQELPLIDRQLRAELKLGDEIGTEGLRRIPPISLNRIEQIAEDLE
jgi:hypothetical protein